MSLLHRLRSWLAWLPPSSRFGLVKRLPLPTRGATSFTTPAVSLFSCAPLRRIADETCRSVRSGASTSHVRFQLTNFKKIVGFSVVGVECEAVRALIAHPRARLPIAPLVRAIPRGQFRRGA